MKKRRAGGPTFCFCFWEHQCERVSEWMTESSAFKCKPRMLDVTHLPCRNKLLCRHQGKHTQAGERQAHTRTHTYTQSEALSLSITLYDILTRTFCQTSNTHTWSYNHTLTCEMKVKFKETREENTRLFSFLSLSIIKQALRTCRRVTFGLQTTITGKH